MEIKLSNTRPFSELKHMDWFIEFGGHIGIKVDVGEYDIHGNPKLCALFLAPYYNVIQNMCYNPQVQVLENVVVNYEFAQKIMKEFVVKKEVDEFQKGQLSFNEIPF